jgi:hypothetical protein
MSTSPTRRFNRQHKRMYAKIEKEFLQRIKGKTNDEVAVILEQIRIKYNLDQFNKPEEETIEQV